MFCLQKHNSLSKITNQDINIKDLENEDVENNDFKNKDFDKKTNQDDFNKSNQTQVDEFNKSNQTLVDEIQSLINLSIINTQTLELEKINNETSKLKVKYDNDITLLKLRIIELEQDNKKLKQYNENQYLTYNENENENQYLTSNENENQYLTSNENQYFNSTDDINKNKDIKDSKIKLHWINFHLDIFGIKSDWNYPKMWKTIKQSIEMLYIVDGFLPKTNNLIVMPNQWDFVRWIRAIIEINKYGMSNSNEVHRRYTSYLHKIIRLILYGKYIINPDYTLNPNTTLGKFDEEIDMIWYLLEYTKSLF